MKKSLVIYILLSGFCIFNNLWGMDAIQAHQKEDKEQTFLRGLHPIEQFARATSFRTLINEKLQSLKIPSLEATEVEENLSNIAVWYRKQAEALPFQQFRATSEEERLRLQDSTAAYAETCADISSEVALIISSSSGNSSASDD